MSAVNFAQTRARDSRIFERHSDDWYVEPVWVWHRLFEFFGFAPKSHVYDPACGRGTAVEAACKAGLTGIGADIVARWGDPRNLNGSYIVNNFLEPAQEVCADVIVSNPPFKIARQFAELAIEKYEVVCLLLPAVWACGDTKSRWLSSTPLSDILFLTPRPAMEPGLGLLPGQKLGGGTKDFAIFVWTRGHVGAPRAGWLHRDGDRAADWCAERAR